MKNIKLKSSLLAGLSALLFLLPSTLKDIAKPHLGVYECKEAKLGKEEYLDRFDEIVLELKGDGEFILYYAEKGGEKKREKGKYRYDSERGVLTVVAGGGRLLKREFPLKEGELLVQFPVGGKWLSLRFEQK